VATPLQDRAPQAYEPQGGYSSTGWYTQAQPGYATPPGYAQQSGYGAQPGYGAQAAYPGPPLDVLWVDDQPERKAAAREVLETLGLQVRHESKSSAASTAIRQRKPDLLISDISRGRDRSAGFAMVQRLKEEGVYDGPVIFYTIRQSPEREERAAELGAGLTNNEQALRDLVLSVLREHARASAGPAVPPPPLPARTSEPPSDPAPPPSADPSAAPASD
jgi:CheY-like chemotaxis protein